uniref:Uncharacterized protein n=1 Tax=Arundo donax TaxID=35708 RepID=A0A0A9DJ07_ARUDO
MLPLTRSLDIRGKSNKKDKKPWQDKVSEEVIRHNCY